MNNRVSIQGRDLSSRALSLGACRGRGVVPTQGGGCYSTPLGWLESNESCFQRLGTSSRPSTHHLLTRYLRHLRGFAHGLMRHGDRELISWVGRARLRAMWA